MSAARRGAVALGGPRVAGISRRALLRGAGLSAFFLPSLARGAQPQGRRPAVVHYVTSHGVVPAAFGLLPEGQAGVVDLAGLSQGQWSPILEPLSPFARELLVIDGLASLAGALSVAPPHEASQAAALTGCVGVTPAQGGIAAPDGPSIDQLLAASSAFPLASLEYAVGGLAVCFTEAGAPLPAETDPLAAFSRLFPGWDDAGARAARVRARQGSVLDLVAEEYAGLAGRLSGDDRRKLEAHRDLLRDLEGQLDQLDALRDACAGEVAPEALRDTADPTFPATAAASFFALTRVALGCGFTDVVTLRFDTVTTGAIDAPEGDLHNDYAHAAATDAVAAEVMTAYHRFHAERFAELLSLLDAVEGEDGTLLDGTIAVWANELATGPHTFAGVPVVAATGSDRLRTGQYRRYAPVATVTGSAGPEEVGPPLNRWLVTLAQAAGEAVDSVGETSFPTDDGGTLDATGPLDG